MSDNRSSLATAKRPTGASRWIFKRFIGAHAFLIRRGLARRMGNMPLILLTTTGRKTGRPSTTPLGAIRDGAAWIVIGSNGGSDLHPQWWLNLVANPKASIEVDGRRVAVRMEEVTDPAERERVWNRVIQTSRGYAAYPKKTTRVIPLARLQPMQA